MHGSLNYYQGNRSQISAILWIDQLIFIKYGKLVARTAIDDSGAGSGTA
jgi:hypothetical protein